MYDLKRDHLLIDDNFDLRHVGRDLKCIIGIVTAPCACRSTPRTRHDRRVFGIIDDHLA